MSVNFKALLKLFKSRLSQRIVLWIFVSIVIIEAIILVPSVNRRQQELLSQLTEVSRVKISWVVDAFPEASGRELLAEIEKLQDVQMIVGGAIYSADGQQLGSFGELPDLSFSQTSRGDAFYLLSRNGSRYDAVWPAEKMGRKYVLIIRYDASDVRRELYAYILRIAGLVLIISVFVTFVMMLALGRTVIAPILRLRQDLIKAGEAISKDKPPPKFYSASIQRRDELGEVIAAFREMFYQISEAISDRKQAEAALRQAEEKYRSIYENAVEGIFQTTPDGRFIAANPALVRIYGYDSSEELIARITDIAKQLYVNPKRHAEFIAALEKDDFLSNFESQIRRRDGTIVWISENVRTVRDDRRNLLYYEGLVKDITERRVWEEALRYQQQRNEWLLHNILPPPIAERLTKGENTIADSFADVTVLFADLVGFTEISAQISAIELVKCLNQVFSEFDRLVDRYGLEKIKTIGDAYMVVCGIPRPRPDNAEAIAEIALDMQAAIGQFHHRNDQPFQLRIGIHSGPVVAGVIGTKKFIYDLWGDTVNTASRMESHGIPGKIQVTAETYNKLKDNYQLESRGEISIKGKGKMVTYLLIGREKSWDSKR